MKDSGIEWIGEIPEDWEIRKGKTLYTISTGKLDVNAKDSNGIYPFFTCSVSPKKINTYAFDCEALLVAGNGIVGYTQYYKGKFNAYQRTYILRDFQNVYPKYLKYYVSECLSIEVAPNSVGSVIQFIKFGDLANFNIVLPTKYRQIKIADFLDDKCVKIDNLIAHEQVMIEELKAYKQSVITEAVTKGLDKIVSIKDSGVEWIGEIPKNWEILRIKNIGWTQNGISKGGDYFGQGYPFVSYGDVYKNMALPEKVNGLIETTEQERNNYSVEENDIFFTRTSETIEEVGFSCVCKKTIPNATYAGFLIRLRLFNNEKICIDYAKYYFRGAHIRKYLVKEMNIVTRASLGQDLLKAMSVTLPTLEEQQQIAEYLDNKCADIDSLISIKQQKIEELKEYKKSLIYEYVTGKKEVA